MSECLGQQSIVTLVAFVLVGFLTVSQSSAQETSRDAREGNRFANPSEQAERIPWRDFSTARLKDLREKQKPVLVFCRADWDATCALMDRTLLADKRVIDAIQQRKYIPLRADCSKAPDEMLNDFLKKVGWAGTATVVVFRKANGTEPVVLRVDSERKLISAEDLLDAMKPKRKAM